MSIDIETVYRCTTLILGTGLAIRAVETLSLLREYEKRGMLDYAITGNDLLLHNRLSARLAERLYSKSGVATLSLLSLVSFLGALLADYGSSTHQVMLAVLIVVNVALYYRQAFGLDGADQMAFLILITLLLCSVLPADLGVRQIGVWFVALQLALSYFVSGCAKLISREWRTGLALEGILSTYTYGTGWTRNTVARNRVLCVAAGWGVILTEIALPFGLLLDAPGVFLVLAVGLSMHLAIAALMGLNDFVWSFAAAYPSFFFVGTVLMPRG